MSIGLHAGGGVAGPSDDDPGSPPEARRPNVSGDLAAVLQAAPMFRRAAVGYDRFQVDTYVRWAEDELAAADREREHLVGRLLRTRQALDEATVLLSHSAGGAELLRVSDRVGSMLAAAADEAQSIRSEAEAERSRAAARAEATVARADRLLADAEAEAHRTVAEAALEAEALAAEAARLVDEAHRAGHEARTEAAARLEKVRLIEQRAAEDADRLLRQAADAVRAARLQARDEIVGMLSTAREERRRADAAAEASRRRAVQDAATQVSALRAEVRALERRRAVLQGPVERRAAAVAAPAPAGLDAHLRRLAERLRWRHRTLRAP